MDDLLRGEQRAALLHVLQDHGVRFLDQHPGVFARVVGVAALIVHGNDHVHAVAAAGLIVVRAEARSGMDAARAGVHGDVIGQDKAGGLRQERMVCQHIFKERALVAGDDGIVLHAADLHDLLHERLGDEILLAVLVIADDDIAFDRVQRDGEVAGQRPDRGRPDDEREVLLLLVRELALIVVQGELDIDRGAGIVLIFDLGLSQRRLIVVAPVDGLQALIDVALFVHRTEDLDLLGLKAGGHGLIRVLPVGHDAEALEALHLHVNIMLREVMAGGAELRDGHGLVVELVLLDDGGLDGHTVVVPAGDVRGVVPAHGRRADHKVLDALVERVAHVQRAVGERRAVVQGKAGLALVLFEQFVVKVEFLPVLQHIRLAHRKPAAHRKARLVHVERLFVFHNSSCKNKTPRALAQGDK